MQAAGASNRPISLQPFGQVPFRAVCGVAALANSRAIGCAPRLASHPEKGLARLQKDLEQVLTSNDHSIHGAAGALWYARDGRRVVTPTGQTLAGFLSCIALVLALVGMSMG